jgi:archaellum component FlaC
VLGWEKSQLKKQLAERDFDLEELYKNLASLESEYELLESRLNECTDEQRRAT